ncbi:hypothetical protein GMDG_05626 [Pseudogymnoascus destructans 20631-21]|uniref:UPF3 domain-containing protein n=1 Tax=Pseudogymnoascus destructans (strain ATCC MYA-4855 / 20631-21) TaxID=658429 RepID=L8FP58_PSED2|nr:hypothetical protein GMDG_05626 [Pseudogymnoascus destructans 20631-21]
MTSRAQANGVLPIPASQTAPKMSKASQNRAGPSLKVVVRRLAPALTETEFMKIIGDEWKVGAGRVDWFSYKPGKVSTDPSKASRPSRAYLHLINEPYLTQLSNHVRQLTFEDAAKTFTNPCLLGPASLEYTSYARIPSGKRRTDARQGTIDLDPEFMDFLESLANPKSTKGEDTEPSTKGEKVTTTPLVQYLKDKKANKSKEAAAAKAAKQSRLESQAASASGKSKSKEGAADEPHKKTPKDGKRERLVEKAAREAVRVLNREASKATGAQAQPGNAAPTEAPKNPRAATRERGSIAAAARILQRDLGLSPVNAHRRAKVEAGAAAKSEAAAASAPQGPKAGPSNAGGGGKGKGRVENNKAKEPTPAITLLKKPVEPAAAAPPASSASPKPAAGTSAPPSTSRQTASASQPNPPQRPLRPQTSAPPRPHRRRHPRLRQARQPLARRHRAAPPRSHDRLRRGDERRDR